jgi:hypothetical protein
VSPCMILDDTRPARRWEGSAANWADGSRGRHAGRDDVKIIYAPKCRQAKK